MPKKNHRKVNSSLRRSDTAEAPRSEICFPFTAIVGQDEMKLSLLLTVIDPHIGGVILMGHRGTGKSTAVRSLARLLPTIKRVKGCLYGCEPGAEAEYCDDCKILSAAGRISSERGNVRVVDLPLGATEDRICGTLDIERALVEGVKVFEPGLLARANRGFLYIDEVNLLEDHLVDVLLDSAASGQNIVEREGISVSHPARYVLVGSGNPEEGELRPQLLDRFGLYAQIETICDVDQRVEIVQRRESFEDDAESFCASWEESQSALRRRISRAQKQVRRIQIERHLLEAAAALCISLKVDGHRGELTLARAARALGAFEGRTKTTLEDVARVARMSLRHRLRRDPLESIGSADRIDQAVAELLDRGSTKTRLQAVR